MASSPSATVFMVSNTPRDAGYFEQLYQTQADPWGYRHAGEQGKYRVTLAAATRWQPAPRRALDVGCSLGYLTALLADYTPDVSAFDISETAVGLTQKRCAALNTPTRFDIRLGDALSPDYPTEYFDVIFAGDVLQGAFESSPRAVQAVQALLPLLTPGGVLIVVDFLNPAQQSEYRRMVEDAGAMVLEDLYFNDRYWFRLKGALKGFRNTAVGQRLLCNQSVYRFLARRASRRGPLGSKHFGLVVRNKSD